MNNNYQQLNTYMEDNRQHTSGLSEMEKMPVKVYVFPPRHVPEQYVRSYNYNFDNNFAGIIADSTQGLNVSSLMGSEAVQQAVLPNPAGMLLDTGYLSSSWSFVIIIDHSKIMSTPTLQYGPDIDIYHGYCVGEPCNPVTGTPNQDCVYVVTNRSLARHQLAAGSAGSVDNMNVQKVDVVPKNVGQLLSDDVYIGTIGNLSNVIHNDRMTGTNTTTIAENDPLHDPQRVKSCTLGHASKDAKQHINSITKCISRGIHAHDANTMGNTISGYGADAMLPIDPHDTMQRVVAEQGLAHDLPMHDRGFDITCPFTFNQFRGKYDQYMAFVQCDAERNAWEVTPGGEATPRNMACSLIHNAIEAGMATHNIADLSFRYSSYLKKDNTDAYSEFGLWQPLHIGTILAANQQTIQGNWEIFKMYLEASLFPTVKYLGGEFDLMIYINSVGECLIDLNYKDDFHGVKNNYEGLGYYQTDARTSGLANPVLANMHQCMNNQGMVEGLVDAVADTRYNPQGYNFQDNAVIA